MKKKLSAYLTLLTLIGSFLVSPINVLEETNASTKETTSSSIIDSNSADVVKKSSTEVEQKNSTSTINSTINSSQSVEALQTTSEPKQTEIVEDSQPRGPTIVDSQTAPRKKGAAVSSEIGNIITKATITDGRGNPIDYVTQGTDIQMNFEFSLPNNTVHEGDTSTIQLPNELRFLKNQTFDVRNGNGDLIATAVIDQKTKTLKLTYTDFVESHSDVSGSLYFTVRIDTAVVQENKEIPISIDLNGTPHFLGNVKYEKVGDNPNEKFTKYAWFENDEGTEINYVLRVNGSRQNYTNAVVEDNLQSDGLSYDKSSFRVLKGTWKVNSSGNYDLENSQDVTNQVQIEFKANDRGFIVKLGDLNGEGYRVDYKVFTNHSPINGETFTNNAKMTGNNVVVESRKVNMIYQTAGGNASGYKYKINIHKTNEQGDNLAGAEFEVMRDSVGSVVGKIVTDESGNGNIGELLKDNYTLKETKAPEGYELLTEEIKISPNDFESNYEVYKEIVNKKVELISINGEKIWNDSDNQDGKRPEKIKVNLLANNKVVATKEVSEADGWKYQFENLPKYENGQRIVYTVTEDQVPDYSTKINGFDIINSYTPGKTSIGVTKAWNDNNNQDGLRPNSVTVQLYANGEKTGKAIELNKANNWTTTWSELPEKDKGQAIKYTVKEISDVPGYTSKITGSNAGNVTITNTHIPEVTQVNGTKTWDDNDNQDGKRPEKIKVNLLANGNVVATKEVSEADGWKYQFENLPKYEKGQAIAYTVTEDQVPDYSTEINGFDITNSYTPGKTSIGVTKAWDDNNNQDGLRPNSVKVQLYANGKAEGKPVELNTGNQWNHIWRNLAEKAAGKHITYTVKELTKIKGYTMVMEDVDKGNIIITNVHKPQSTSIQANRRNKNTNYTSKSGILPKTGSESSIVLTVLGVLLIAGLGGMLKKRT